MDDVLSLIAMTMANDKYGVQKPSYGFRRVYCKVLSVSRSEFFDAGRNGLNPEYKFTMFGGDYAGEQLCEYHGQTYSIYRTYRTPGTDTIELYVDRKGGANGIVPTVPEAAQHGTQENQAEQT